MANLNLAQRSKLIKDTLQIKMDKAKLARIYKRHNIRHRKLYYNLYSRYQTEYPYDHWLDQKQYIKRIVLAYRRQENILFLDETTLNNWHHNQKVWYNLQDPMRIMLPQMRMSRTIIGSIGYKTGSFRYMITKTTNTETVRTFLDELMELE